jgi:cysteinyl-tRNA synthetase
MVAGSRVEINDNKRNPFDFVLVESRQTGRTVMAKPLGRRGGPVGTLNARP